MTGTWHTADIAGKPADVYAPPSARPRFGVLYLHPVGLETLVGNSAFTRVFDELRLACACPHGGPCWWTDRVCTVFDPVVTPERYLLDSVLPWFHTTWGLAP